jgi:predicted ATPase
MTEKEILVLHDAVYQYLMELHEKDATFKFRVRPENDDNLKKGYWFSHVSRSYRFQLTFWTFSDANLGTPLIEFYIPLTADASVHDSYVSLWNKDEDNQEQNSYFHKMANELGFKKLTAVGKELIGIYHKSIEEERNVLNLLDYFIKNEKPKIDAYIKQNPFPDVVDFISDEDFAKDIERVETYRNHTLTNEIWQESQVLLEEFRLSQHPQTHLANALSRLYVANFQGIKELTIENLPLSNRWIFLTGENGFGKTSVLRAIAKGLVGDEIFVQPMPKNAHILLNGFINNQPFRNNLSEKQEIKIPVATYGVSRFQLTANDQAASDRSQQKTYSLFHDDGQLINIEQELITTFAYNKPRFDQLSALFLQIIPNLKDIKIDTTNGSPKVRYYEKDDQNRTYEAVSLNELAAGYRSILTMIGDMVIRLSENKEAIKDLSGIVLIDELDAHLHPKYQYELPKLLSDVFPKVQFIVTTHSPIPILGLPEDNQPIILTVERNSEKGITIDRKDDDFDIRQLNPEALLTSPIFNFQTLFARGAKTETIIPTSDFKEVIEIETIKKRLKNLRESGLIN